MHFHMNRGGGPRGMRWQHGPFSFELSTSGWREDMREQVGAAMGHGRGRARRMFDGGELRLVLLKLIADQPRHGYDLIRHIEELTGGAYAPSPGVVYPTLTLLDEMGHIEEERSEGAKKRFAATDEGRAHLDGNAEQVAALMARLTDLGAERRRGDRAPVRRAMANLRHAVNDRLFYGGELSDETAHELAALLDEAAQKIERLR